MSKHSDHEDHHRSIESRTRWLFKEFWPLIFFIVIFMGVMSLPLLFTGNFLAFYIILAFLGALLTVLLIPRIIGFYILLWAAILFFALPNAWNVGAGVALIFMGAILLGIFFFPRRKYKD